MALYAFDGTWNKPDSDTEDGDSNTNVRRFLNLYASGDEEADAARAEFERIYQQGVGTRFGRAGRIVGGLTGAGGHIRVDEAVKSFAELWARNQEKEDRVVDVIGFSRGAAIALDFCNRLARGVKVDGETVRPRIRFLGLWDIVSAFGAPGLVLSEARSIDIGWELDLPPNVDHAFHAMALDEHRQAFDAHRLDPEHDDSGVVEEVWFRGGHGDIGGGNQNIARNNITLHWMLQKGLDCGLPLRPEDVAKIGAAADPATSLGGLKKQGRSLDRAILPGDVFHPTAGRVLEAGDSVVVAVDSRLWYDFSGLLVVPGGRYTFVPDPAGRWTDKTIECDATGWPEDLNRGRTWWERLKGGVEEAILQSSAVGLLRRVKTANWFELCACLEAEDSGAFPVGKGQCAEAGHAWTSPSGGALFFFANDGKLPGTDLYKNNQGTLNVTVTRVA